MSSPWTPEKLKQINERFNDRSPQHVLQWTFDTFGEDAVMGTGFGYSGVALMHMLAKVRSDATVFFLDTDLLFPETYTLRDRLADRIGLKIERVRSGLSLDEQSDKHGAELWNREPDTCCFLRKVKPLRRYLSDKSAWVTAIRRDQSPTRTNTRVVEWNEVNEVVKINPLAAWTSEKTWAYIRAHDLPYNELHDEGYPSIGCMPCTDPVSGDHDERSGRWAGRTKTECGLHLEPQTS